MTPAAAKELIAPVCDGIPYNQLLGMRLREVGPEGVSVGIDHRPDLVNNPLAGTLHGGVISSVVDLTGGMSALAVLMFEHELDTHDKILERFVRFGTVDLRVDYLRPGRGTYFISSGFIMRSGRRIAVVRMEFTNEEGSLLATGTGTYVTG